MDHVPGMISSHPQDVREPKKSKMVAAIQSCFDCGQACVTCSDACLGEENPVQLRSVIRATADCADLCLATGKILSRLNNPNFESLRDLVKACITQVRSCGMECNEHARHHEHCRLCAESCREAESALEDYLSEIEG